MPSTQKPDGSIAGVAMRGAGPAAVLFLVAVVLVCVTMPAAPDGPRYAGAGQARPTRGGTFVFFHETDLRGMDPQVAYDELSNMALKLLFEGLLDYDHDANLVPRLATQMPEVTPDGRTFVFTLRRGVRFHNGRELVADDVRWSMEHMLAPSTNSPGASFYTLIDGVDAYQARRAPHVRGIRVLDRYRISFTLTAADQTFLNAMAMTFAYPVARENYARWDATEVARHPVGTGAYMLATWEAGVRLTFTRNPRYFRPGEPYPDGMVFELNLTREAAFRRFRNGQIDHVHRLTPADYLFLRSAPKWNATREEYPLVDVWGLTMNCELPPFDNVHVRRAVGFAVDRERWNRARAYRLLPTGQPVPPALMGYTRDLPERQVFDLARAREEMRLAGFPNGVPGEISLWIGEGATGRVYGELAQSDLAKIGIRIRIKPVAFPVYLQETGKRRTAQLVYSGWSMDFPDPSNFLDILFHSRSIHESNSENRSFYSNPALDALLDRAKIERDRTVRAGMYREASAIVARDAPWAFVNNSKQTEVWQPYVRNYRPHSVWSNMYRDVWLDEPRRRIAARLQTFGRSRLAALLPFGGL